jgi:hypothetical protein
MTRLGLTPFATLAVLGVAIATALGGGGGCSSPSAANITLRKQNAKLRDRIATLEREQRATKSTIAALESGATTVPVLPSERVGRLFTTHGIQIGRLTGGADFDTSKPGDEGLKIYVTPSDNTGDDLKAAGTFVVEAFDLTQPNGGLRVGRWEFDSATAQRYWRSLGILYGYVLEAPWQDAPPPRARELTVRVTFTDELTGRTFTEQRVVKVTPPPATNPVAQTASDRPRS